MVSYLLGAEGGVGAALHAVHGKLDARAKARRAGGVRRASLPSQGSNSGREQHALKPGDIAGRKAR